LLRIKLAYNESLFGWKVSDEKLLFEVLSESMANWMGYDSVMAVQQNEAAQRMID